MEDTLEFYTKYMEKSQSFPVACTFFAIAFSAEKQACGPDVPPLAGASGKGIGSIISDYGFFELSFSIQVP